MEKALTQSRVRELFRYDPVTGALTWAVDTGRVKAGDAAGSSNGNGYLRVGVDCKLHYVHRIVWLYVYGEWPRLIDHIDRNRRNNALVNLRAVSQTINMLNQKRERRANKHGLMGVTKNGSRYSAGLQVHGKYIHLGQFDTPELAHAAYAGYKADVLCRT